MEIHGKLGEDTYECAAFHGKKSSARALIEALGRSQAIIEFKPDGTILTANGNFLTVMGYSLEEIRGQHHRMFVVPEEAGSDEYKEFWSDLALVNFRLQNISELAKMAVKYGSKQAITL